MNPIVCTWDAFNDTLYANLPGFEDFNASMIERTHLGSDGSKLCIVMAGLSYMFIFKTATSLNLDKYCQNRLRAFCQVIGAPQLYDVAYSMKPSLASCVLLKSIMGSVFNIRREAFVSMTSLARAQWNGKKLFVTILELLSFNELMHIYNIDMYLCKMYRELLVTKTLRAERSNYIRACEYLATLPKSAWAYAKILYPPAETEPLLSRHLRLMGAAASVLMKMLNKTAFYYEGYKDVDPSFTKYVELWANFRNITAPLCILDSAEAQTSVTERNRLLKLIEQTILEPDQILQIEGASNHANNRFRWSIIFFIR